MSGHNDRIQIGGILDLLEHRNLFVCAAKNNVCFFSMVMNLVQQSGPSFEWPPFVIRVQPAPPLSLCPHAAMISRLYENELLARPALALEPCVAFCPLAIQDVQSRPIDRCEIRYRVVGSLDALWCPSSETDHSIDQGLGVLDRLIC